MSPRWDEIRPRPTEFPPADHTHAPEDIVPPISGGGTPSATVATQDGTGNAGASADYSRGDHKHADANRPTTDEKAALAGTSGTPGAANKFVTNGDARNTNARTPSAHTHDPSEVTGTAVVTADARLSDARTPLAHVHAAGDVTGTAVLTADARLSDARTPLAHVHAAGDVTGTAVLTADARLSDARTPLAHSHAPADTTGTAVITSDARLSDARTPTAHSHAPSDTTGTAVVTADSRLSDARTPTAHVITDAAVHTFPGGTATYLRADGTFAGVTATPPDLAVTLRAPTLDESIAANSCVFAEEEYVIADGKELVIEDAGSLAIL